MSNKTPSIIISVAAASIAAVAGYIWYQNLHSKSPKQSTSKPQNSSQVLQLPVIEASTFFNKSSNPEMYRRECLKVAEALHKYGVAIIRDPRVNEEDNNKFLNMLERYFEGSDGIRDARPEFHYQVGVTPSHVERPRDHCRAMGAYGPDNKPLSPCPPELDPKWRFFWRVGPVPEKTAFPILNMDPVIPPEFPEWKTIMDMWGNKMLDALFVFAEMAAVGFNIPTDAFTSLMKGGPHLLAPTGSNFNEFNQVGQILAGFHYDLNFLTIHGKSRFPGLFIWTREGERMTLEIPDGCLLIQAGKQIEHLTGGYVLAGFHEVVVTPSTAQVIERRLNQGQSLWRVSSTCFGHIQSDQLLRPLGHFNTPTTAAQFPPILAGNQVQDELKVISLDKSKSS